MSLVPLEEQVHHLVVDCVTGTVTRIPLSAQEIADAQERGRAAEAVWQAAEAERARLAALAAACTDPLVRELAKRAGLA